MKKVLLWTYRVIAVIVLLLVVSALLVMAAGMVCAFLFIQFMNLYPPYTVWVGLSMLAGGFLVWMVSSLGKYIKRKLIPRQVSPEPDLSEEENAAALHAVLSQYPQVSFEGDNLYHLSLAGPGHFIECSPPVEYVMPYEFIQVRVMLNEYGCDSSYHCDQITQARRESELSRVLDDILSDRLVQLMFFDENENLSHCELCEADRVDEPITTAFTAVLKLSPVRRFLTRLFLVILLFPPGQWEYSRLIKAEICSANGTQNRTIFADPPST